MNSDRTKHTNMLNIPQDLYESATIDGAGSFKQFIYITFPLLRGTHITLIILDILGALKFFDLSYVLTDGGPAHATETFSTYIYTKSFSTFQQGPFIISCSRNFTKFTKCSDWIIMFFVFFFDCLIYMFMTNQA